MSRECKVECDSGTPYIVLRNQADQVFYIAGQVCEDWGTGGRDADDYDVVLTFRGGTRWSGDAPAGLPAGRYTRQAFVMGGSNPADGDYFLGSNEMVWDGSAEVFGFDTNGRIVIAADGLDNISVAEPSGAPSGWNFTDWLNWLIRRFSNKTILDASGSPNTLKVRNDADDGDLSTQNVSEASDVQTVTKAT